MLAASAISNRRRSSDRQGKPRLDISHRTSVSRAAYPQLDTLASSAISNWRRSSDRYVKHRPDISCSHLGLQSSIYITYYAWLADNRKSENALKLTGQAWIRHLTLTLPPSAKHTHHITCLAHRRWRLGERPPVDRPNVRSISRVGRPITREAYISQSMLGSPAITTRRTG
jgi:hypothetical protein